MVSRVWDKSKPPKGSFTLNRDCPQAQGLVAWYPMGGASGGNFVADYAGKYHLGGNNASWGLGASGEPASKFLTADTAFLSTTPAPITTYPLSMACWWTPGAAIASTQSLICIGAAGSVANMFELVYIGLPSPTLQTRAYLTTGAHADVAYTPASGVPAHCLGVQASATSRTAYINGIAGTTDTTSKTRRL